jgi:hypothetical protein
MHRDLKRVVRAAFALKKAICNHEGGGLFSAVSGENETRPSTLLELGWNGISVACLMVLTK